VVQRVAQRDMIGAAARDVVHAGVLKVHMALCSCLTISRSRAR
jgi:hypothetical protein